MKLLVVLTIVSVFYGNGLQVKAAAWGYEDPIGPSTWVNSYPDCGKNAQSPIDIIHNDAVINESLGVFKRSYFDSQPMSMLIKNTKHSLQVDLNNGYTIDDPLLLPAAYKALQFHLHWAKPGMKGSEHTVDGVRYFGELHIVHYNTKYTDIAVAVNSSDGLAVTGFFLQDDYPQDNLEMNRILDPVVNGVARYYKQNQTYASTFSLETFLPANLSVYYRYQGSLTTPSCKQSVLWTVFREPIRISRNQAAILETMLYENQMGETNVQLFGNYRPIQPLNGRRVTRSVACAGAGVPQTLLSIHLLSFCFLVLSYISLN